MSQLSLWACSLLILSACQASSQAVSPVKNSPLPAAPSGAPVASSLSSPLTPPVSSAAASPVVPRSDFTTLSCEQPLFIDQVSQWQEKRVNGGGMDAIRQAIDASPRDQAVRLTLAPGTYRGQCLYLENHHRSAAAPLWIRGEGEVQMDCQDGNGQAIALENSSWIALDHLTIGPAQGYYGDSAVHIAGHPVEIENPAKYGQYQLAHHVIVRDITARNLNRGPDGDSNPDAYESGCCDGIKVNQAEHIWLINNQISRTARHGIDLVGVHHAALCRNQLTHMVGAGHGMEAKGGSEDILFDSNTVVGARHRALLLGGEGTADVYMHPIGAQYEGKRQLARNNVFLNASEGGIGFYGCQDCAAVNNTIWQMPGFQSQTRDLIRMYPSILEAADEWGGAKRVGEVIPNRNNLVANNLMGASEPGVTCALEAGPQGVEGLSMHHNLWWNGGQALPECGEGALSIQHYTDASSFFATRDPLLRLNGTQLIPGPNSPALSAGVAFTGVPSQDSRGQVRPTLPTLGAFESR